MKTMALFLLFVAAGFCSATGQNKMEIDRLLTEWHNAAAEADQQKFFDFIDDEGIYIGTDSTEIWTKKEFFDWSTPHFNNNKTWNFRATKRHIYFANDPTVAWFDELIDYGSGTLRGSGVLQKRNNEWKIMQYVLSLPVPNEKYKAVMQVIKATD